MEPKMESVLETRAIKDVLPAEASAYFNQVEEKHFNPETAVGSLFTEVKSLESLLKLAKKQRGSLDGDDRELFIKMGVPAEALLPMCRYLKVETGGEVGIVKLAELADKVEVRVLRTKQNVPCTLAVASDTMPTTDFGTIIIGPNKKNKPEDPEPSTAEMVWTVHPGLPVRPVMEDFWQEGSVVSAGAIRERFIEKGIPIENIYLNVIKQ
jgi:hypothetical protein